MSTASRVKPSRNKAKSHLLADVIVPGKACTTVVGLRVDVDTLRGTRLGVPRLLNAMATRGILASYFFSVGPDNMGRHLWRLIRPKFLLKMLRSKAASLYGWDIILRGVFWPGPKIGRACDILMRRTAAQGHEVGIHAWDHHRWQIHLDAMSPEQLHAEIDRGVTELARILGVAPNCSASAGWRCNERVLADKERLAMQYHSDCRGESVFRPLINGVPTTPQVPVTLPTYDEVIGRNGINDENYNEYLLRLIDSKKLNILTIHAEVEGIAKHELFCNFLDEANHRGVRFAPLGEFVSDTSDIPVGRIAEAPVDGRDGSVCIQAKA